MIPPALRNILQNDPIVISGMGVASSAGNSISDLWETALIGIGPATWQEFVWGREAWQTAVCAVAGIEELLDAHPRAGKLDRTIQLALHAGGEALAQAGAVGDRAALDRVGLVIGSSRGPRTQWMEAVKRSAVFPSDAAVSTIASLTGNLSKCFGITGPCFTVSATCTSGATAVGLAAQQILLGAADIMLVGGTDSPLHPMMVAQLRMAGVLGHHDDPARTCRPFDPTRNGLCLGEGAGFLVLESSRMAKLRGATPLAILSGWATASENVGRTAVGVGGGTLKRTMLTALDLAGLGPPEISSISPHGTGTRMNDAAEADAIQSTFGETGCPPLSSTKPVTGHCLGATPVIEAILCVQALLHQTLPPTANSSESEYPLDIVPLRRRAAVLEHILSNSLGFWGKHGTLVFSRKG